MQETVLITGASGLVGQRLCQLLIGKGYRVLTLGRNANGKDAFSWDPLKGVLDEKAIRKIDHIIHLAGANIGEKPWTEVRREEILQSRVAGCNLLFDVCSKTGTHPKTVISASAIGYYGYSTGEIFNEFSPAGEGFLADVCRQWEASALRFEETGSRTVLMRTGLVLSNRGGVLPALVKTVRAGLAAPLGTGRQGMPWIHLDDLCDLYLEALSNPSMSGPYNAVAPEKTDNRHFTRTLARHLRKPFWALAVPGFVLRMALGSRSELLLKGQQVESCRLFHRGYNLRFSTLDRVFSDLYPE